MYLIKELRKKNCRNNSERLFVDMNFNLRLISMCFKEFARMCELIYKIFEDLKEQECWWVIGSEQTLNYRGVSLQVKYKLKLILICFVKVNQHIWTMCINVQKVEDLKIQFRKYDLQARIVISTYELSTKNHIHFHQNTWLTYKKYWVLSHN